MKKIHLYFRVPPQKHRYIPGDQYLIGLIKKLFFKPKTSGVKKVFDNLCLGFDRLKIDYDINLSFKKINPDEPVVMLGSGRYALEGYDRQNPVIAGIGLMTHPSEWPRLCDEYPVVKYLQHSDWGNNIYVPFYGAKTCGLWPAGIDTARWSPDNSATKQFDFLIYNKIRWNNEQVDADLRLPIIDQLKLLGLTYHELVYGHYDEDGYYEALKSSRGMIFLCEHESQGFALCEALSVNVPVFAWDQGFCLDPNRFKWNDPVIPASSVPFFDDRCGMRFTDYKNFELLIDEFLAKLHKGTFTPRKYILENLTLEKSAAQMLEIIEDVYQ